MLGSCCSPRQSASRASFVAVPAFSAFLPHMLHEPATSRPTDELPSPMPIDVIDKPAALVVRALLPGVQRDQIDVSLDDGVLTIATRACQCDDADGSVLRQEIQCPPRQRRLRLPFEVVEDQIKGELRDGILNLTFPKVPAVQPRKIPIQG